LALAEKERPTIPSSTQIRKKKIDFTFAREGIRYVWATESRLGQVAAPNKLTLREILHLYFSETVYYGRRSCRCATAACPLRMPSPRRIPVRQRGPVRPASPGFRFHVGPSAPRSRAATTPPFAIRKYQDFVKRTHAISYLSV